MSKALITQALNLIHVACDDAGLMRSRCLATSVIAREVLTVFGAEVELFPCSIVGVSAKLVPFYENLSALSEDEVNTLAAKGARMVGVYANEILDGVTGTARPLFGHVCAVVKLGAESFFIDPTSYQFKRTKRVNGYVVDAPLILISQVPNSFYSTVHALNRLPAGANFDGVTSSKPLKCGGVMRYEYTRLAQLDFSSARDLKETDLNVSRFQHIIDGVLFKFGYRVKGELHG